MTGTLKLCELKGCRRAVNPDVDHEGRPHGGARTRYCSVDHRADARNDRRRALGRWARETAELRALHAQEAAGALVPLPGMMPLPPVPAPPDVTMGTSTA